MSSKGLDYRPMAPNTYFAEERIIHCLVRAAKAKLLTSLQQCQITEADVIMRKVDVEDASVFRIAASLAAWNNYTETDDDQVEGDYALTSTVCCS